MTTTQEVKVGDEIRCDRAIFLNDRVRLRKDGLWFDLVPPQNGPDYLPPGASTRDPLLAERQKTHGDFSKNAEISRKLKDIFYFYHDNSEEKLGVIHREALDMIALKLSRVLSGQADFRDHWDDISGYAKLASEACKK